MVSEHPQRQAQPAAAGRMGRVSVAQARKLRFGNLVTGPNSGGRAETDFKVSCLAQASNRQLPLSSLSVLMEVRKIYL